MARAQDLLKSSNLSIHVIAERCGYLDASSFIRKFKATYGVTPAQYRKQ